MVPVEGGIEPEFIATGGPSSAAGTHTPPVDVDPHIRPDDEGARRRFFDALDNRIASGMFFLLLYVDPFVDYLM